MRSILAACGLLFLGGVLMIAASELALRAAGDGLAGTAVAAVAATAVYLPVVFPMRALLHPPQPAPAVPEEAQAA